MHALLVAKLSLRFESLDAFAEEAGTFLTEFCEEHYEMLCASGGAPGFQITAAGYSAVRGTCRAFSIEAGETGELTLGDGDTVDGLEAVDIHGKELIELPLNRAMILPLPSADAMEDVGLNPGVNIAALDVAGIRRFGTKVLRAQRHVCDVLAEDEEATYAVGGQPVFLTVTKEGVTTSTGPAWPDKVGERIDPTQDLPSENGAATTTVGMSRQQRRELERRQKQAAKR